MLSKKKFHRLTERNKLVVAAIEGLDRVTGIILTEQQMITFLTETGFLSTLTSYGDCDTTLREMMATSMSERLVGEGWPDHTIGEEGFKGFIHRVHVSAVEAGYQTR